MQTNCVFQSIVILVHKAQEFHEHKPFLKLITSLMFPRWIARRPVQVNLVLITDRKTRQIQYLCFRFDKKKNKEKEEQKKNRRTCTNEMLLFMNIYFSKEIVKRSNSSIKLLCGVTRAYKVRLTNNCIEF